MEDDSHDSESTDAPLQNGFLNSDLDSLHSNSSNGESELTSGCHRTILNVPRIVRTMTDEPKSMDQFSSFPTSSADNDNYLMNIKKRCKKKVGRKDKHLISPNPVFTSSNGYATTSEGDTSDKLGSNDSSLLDTLDQDSESILKDYLAILYGEEATSLERNEYDTSFLKLEDSSSDTILTKATKPMSDAEIKFKSIENKFEYRRDGSDGKPFICGICSKAFGQHSNIILHMRSHTGEKPYICDVCSKGFSGKSDLNRHKNIHSVIKKYWCDDCKRGFNDNSGFRRHKLIYHSAISKKCTICPKSYLAQKDLDRHMKTHNKPEKKQNPTKDSPTMVPVQDSKKSSLYDSASESNKLEITSPEPNHQDNPTPTKEIDSSPLLKSSQILKTPTLERSNQEKPFAKEDTKPHKCEQCNFACSKRSNLRKHIAYVHCLERFYKCDICYKGFKSSWALKRHKQVHSEEKIFQCELCEKGFNDTGSFKYHMKSHRGERSYHCEICAKSFILKSDLKKHMSSHIKRIQQAAEQEDMEVLIQSDESFLDMSSFVS